MFRYGRNPEIKSFVIKPLLARWISDFSAAQRQTYLYIPLRQKGDFCYGKQNRQN